MRSSTRHTKLTLALLLILCVLGISFIQGVRLQGTQSVLQPSFNSFNQPAKQENATKTSVGDDPTSDTAAPSTEHPTEIIGSNTTANITIAAKTITEKENSTNGTNIQPTYAKFSPLPEWARYLAGSVGVLVGLFLALLGYRYISWSIFTIAGFVTAFVVYGILQANIPADLDSKAALVYSCSSITWVLAGFLFVCIPRAGFVILGASVGVMIALALNPVALQYVWPESPIYNLYIWMGIFGAITAVLVLWFERPILVLSTSLSGSYLFVMSIGELAGNFPRVEQLGHLDWKGWAYFGGFLGSVIVGLCVQFCVTAKHSDHSDRAKDFEY